MLPFLKLLPWRLPLNGSPRSGHTAVLVKQVENKTKSLKDQKRQEKNYKNKYSVEWGCHNISTMCNAITTLWRRPTKKGIYDFYLKTKQLISLRISFPYELELNLFEFSYRHIQDGYHSKCHLYIVFVFFPQADIFYYKKMLPTSCV